MALSATYTEARANLAQLWDRVVEDREIVRLRRRGRRDVALIAADELDSLLDTAYLLRSPRNAARLYAALQHALEGVGEVKTVSELRRELGLAEEAPGG
ncbi:MAG TPA: type II toxin-antitoxin system prevent-host-death family antitoxin [Chloroflexota bacterium]|jgi:antitoxin YefM